MSTERIAFREAQAEDVPVMIDLIRHGLPRELHSAVIHGTGGAGWFIAAQLRLPPELAESRFFVAAVDGSPVGCLEVRVQADTLFLNHLAVVAAYRGQSIASRLMAHAIRRMQRPGVRYVRLDVADTNEMARSWYERLGFRQQATRRWWAIPPGEAGDNCPSLTVTGFPQAEAQQELLGFSQFNLRTPSGEYPIGRIGELWFRVTQAEALQEPDLLPALWRLDPHRSILAILPGDTLPADLRPQSRLLYSSERMAAEVDPLLQALNQGSAG